MANNKNNKKNLAQSFSEIPPNKLREISRKGQLASTKAKKEKKLIREELEKALQMRMGDYIQAILNKAIIDGSEKAWELVRDTVGEKPIDKIDNKVTAQQDVVVIKNDLPSDSNE